MPILPKEDNLHPPDLLATAYSKPDDAQWLVLHTKPRQEKTVARAALTRDIPFYLPLVRKQNRIRGKLVDSYTPLFSGYFFVLVNEEQRLQILKTNAIVHTLGVEDEEQLVSELRNLQMLISADAPVTIERKLEPGRWVRVKSGPMENTEGVVISRKGKTRLVVAVTLLQQGVSVEIDDFQVEPVY